MPFTRPESLLSSARIVYGERARKREKEREHLTCPVVYFLDDRIKRARAAESYQLRDQRREREREREVNTARRRAKFSSFRCSFFPFATVRAVWVCVDELAGERESAFLDGFRSFGRVCNA